MKNKKIFKHGVMKSIVISEIHRGNYGSVLYALCVRYDKRIFNAYPTIDGNIPMFKVEVRQPDGSLKKYKFQYHIFIKAVSLLKQISLMTKGRGTSAKIIQPQFESVG